MVVNLLWLALLVVHVASHWWLLRLHASYGLTSLVNLRNVQQRETTKHTVDSICRHSIVLCLLLLLLLCSMLCLLLAEGHLSLYCCELLAQFEQFGIGLRTTGFFELIVSLLAN